MLKNSKMKNNWNKKDADPSNQREDIELLTRNDKENDKKVKVVNYNISIENLTQITALEEDEAHKKKKKSCLERMKEIHMGFKILAVLIGLILTLSPFIPKIIAGNNVS